MQNWNQWQLSAGAVATPMPQPPVGYAAPGADPMATMQAYMQYYSQPAPSGYTAEQWATAQQQNWAQWQQWQQQYQQWQAQYGEKYQETMKHMSAQNMNITNQVSQLPIVQPPPPLPKEDTKPPLPPNTYQFTSMPPPHQNNLPLFPAKQSANTTVQTSAQNCPQNPPLPPNQPPLPPESSNCSKENTLTGKRGSSNISESNSAKKLKVEDEELTEAEKTFDAQFKQWEEQFNKWKEQNANHPDKTQYKQYEAKWTSWREKLIERREQMRRKREQQKQAATKTEVDKNKHLPGDDKIMNILSSTENQGLINNLLGIGKTLGLTGKQNTNVPPPPPPPPATETTASNVQTTTMASSSPVISQSTTSQLPVTNMISSNIMSSSPWNSQQWTSQSHYNAGANLSNFPNFQSMTGVPPPPFGAPSTQMPPPNFTQPPPNFPNVPNFSQPPPGFANNDTRQSNNLRSQVSLNVRGRSPFGSNNGAGPDGNLAHSDRLSQAGPMGHPNNLTINESNRQKDSVPLDQFRSNDLFGQRNDNYKLNDDRASENDQFIREDRNYPEQGNNQFSQQKMNFNNDRFALGGDRFGQGNNRFGSVNDRFGPGNDRFGLGNDRSELGNDRFGSGDNRFGNDRFGPGMDRIGSGTESVTDRFGSNDRFSTNIEQFGLGGDRFNRNNLDRFDQKDVGDNRRDGFPNIPRSFGRSNQFEPPDKLAPELKKLMEKRRAALDVFKPSFLDSDKSIGVGSLSESFKKITGDSPFMKSSIGNNNFGPRVSSNFGPGGLGNFRMAGDFKPPGNSEFGSRCSAGIGRNNLFDSRDGGTVSFRGAASSPQQVQDSVNTDPRSEMMINLRTDTDTHIENKGESVIVPEQAEVTNLNSNEQNIDSTLKDCPENYPVQNEIPLLETSTWMEAQFPEDNSMRKDTNDTKENENPSGNCNTLLEQGTRSVIGEATERKSDPSNSYTDINKKTDVLPFMGENDPKPEDLNMEPPPEFPNLGLVPTNANEPIIDPLRRTGDSYDAKEPSAKPFPNNPECSDPRENFDSSFSSRGMQCRPNAPFSGPRGANDGRFPVFEPRDLISFNSSDPNSYLLGPPCTLTDGQLGSRGSTDGQFGPRGPNDGQFRLRGPNDGQFGPRRVNDSQFGSRGINDGQFCLRSANDGLFGPRGPVDSQFGIKGPNSGQFGPRGSNVGQFGPRYDGQFALRRLNDGQFGSQGPNNRQFGPGRPPDVPFDNRGSGEMQFTPRGPNEGQLKFSGPNDRFSGLRRNEVSYQRNSIGLKGTNDGQFTGRFNEKQCGITVEGRFGSQGSSDMSFGSRGPISGGPNDASFGSRGPTDRQFDVRGIGEYRPRGQIDNSLCPKAREASGIGDPEVHGDGGGAFEANDQNQLEQNAQQGQFNSSENSGWKQPYSKNSFGDIDQRSGQDFCYGENPLPPQNEILSQGVASNIERRSPLNTNKSNVPDKRSEKGITDLTPGDCKIGYGESSSGCDYGKFASPNMHKKRSLDNRQPQIMCPVVKEFCIEKQFNYNHGGATADKKFVEHIPAKVIDYAHTSRTSIQDHLTPVQCFDYGHGNLKPLVPDHVVYPKKDFRNWEENELNLKDYTEKMRRYEHYSRKTDSTRSRDYSQRRDSEELINNKKSERERREREDYKGKEREERTRERCETSQKETIEENDKNEERSKGNIKWQENSNKNVVETKPSDISVTDTQHNVVGPAPKTLELPKTPNCTMVDDLLCPPGRQNRPPKIAIILRGPPGSGKSFVAKLIKDKEIEQGGSAPRILSLDDYFLIEKEMESTDDNGKKVTVKEMIYEYEEAMEQSYVTSLVKAFKKNITDGFFNFIILDCINEKISDYEEMWSFAKTKGFKVYVCEMEMDLQICLKRNIHNRTEDEINRIIDYFEPTPSYHQKLDVNSMLQDQAIEEVHMEDSEETLEKSSQQNEDSLDSQEDVQDSVGVSKWERMEAEDKLDRLDGLAKKKSEGKVQTMKDFLQVPDYYNMEDTSGKKRVRWADLEERKEQEKMRAVGFVVGHTNWDRMMDPTKGGSALTRTKFFSLS